MQLCQINFKDIIMAYKWKQSMKSFEYRKNQHLYNRVCKNLHYDIILFKISHTITYLMIMWRVLKLWPSNTCKNIIELPIISHGLSDNSPLYPFLSHIQLIPIFTCCSKPISRFTLSALHDGYSREWYITCKREKDSDIFLACKQNYITL